MRQAIPFGKYLLLDRISVGGMAEVFKAKSYGVEGFEKVIAIKRILPSMGEDRDFIKMFIDEAKIVGQLSHANICQIFELGRTDGAHFIAMEYIWGKDLLQIQNRLRKLKGQMPVAMACFLIAKVCEGLDYAHKKRDALGRPLEIVHRDCSPQNILISYEGEVKMIDFGIAKAASRSSKTQAGVLKGKFGYMSPEQVRGLPLDRRSDLFSIGTILYECLTGDRLFVGETDFSTLEKVRNVNVPSPRSINPNIPEAVDAIIMKALARDAEDRYQWGSELVGDLQRYLMSQEQVFTAKSLAGWLKEAFAADLEKERQQLESFKKVGREGLSAGVPHAEAKLDVVEHLGVAGQSEDPTILGGPSFDDIIAEQAAAGNADVAAMVRGGQSHAQAQAQASAGDEFVEEGPTEIFGEISEVSALSENAPAAGTPAVVVSPSMRQPRNPTPQPGRPTSSGPAVAPRNTPPPQLSNPGDRTISPLAGMSIPVPSALQPPPGASPASQAKTILGMQAPVLPLQPPPTGQGPVVDPAAALAGLSAGQIHGPGSAAAIPMPGFPAPDHFPLGSHPPHQASHQGPHHSPQQGQPYGQPGGGMPPYPNAQAQGPAGMMPYPGAPGGAAFGGAAPFGGPPQQPYQGMPQYPGYPPPGYPGPQYPHYPGYGPPQGANAAGVDMTSKRRKKPSLAKDIAIGIGIAAVVLGAFAIVKFVVLADSGKGAAVAASASGSGSASASGSGTGSAEVGVAAGTAPGSAAAIDPATAPDAAAAPAADLVDAGAAVAIVEDAGAAAAAPDAAPAVAVAVDAGTVGAAVVSIDAGEPKVAVVVPKPDTKPDTKPDSRPDRRKPKTDGKVDTRIDLDEPRPDIVTPKTDPKPKVDSKTDPRPDPKADANVGYLTAYATPFAQVSVDGKPTGKTTPITPMGKIALTPGIHKVTFSVGREKFTYTVKIEAGKTAKITKDLPVTANPE
ncbi:MAG TPA: protein kinase [Kofleriaceae bacterium]|nr:protein kinase [Kofleriaceae bacterium]